MTILFRDLLTFRSCFKLLVGVSDNLDGLGQYLSSMATVIYPTPPPCILDCNLHDTFLHLPHICHTEVKNGKHFVPIAELL